MEMNGSKDTILLLEEGAQLSSRLTNFQPLCSDFQKVKPYPLADIKDIRIQEGLIIKDLLYVLLGFEGSYVRYSEKYDPNVGNLRFQGPDYRINKHLDSSLKEVTKRMVFLSKMLSALVYFTEIYNTEVYGQVVQSLVYEIRQFLKEYILFLDGIEQQFKFDRNFSLRQFEQNIKYKYSYKIELLYEIIQTIYEVNDLRRQEQADSQSQFNNFITNMKNDLKAHMPIDILTDTSNYNVAKGGLVLRIVQDIIDSNNGDPRALEFLSHILNNISSSYLITLNNWITKGELNDNSNNEFFITTNLSNNVQINGINSEQYWNSKFVIKIDGIPKQFLDKDIQLKVLLAGKYLNIVQEAGVVLSPFIGRSVTSLNDNNLHLVIEEAFTIANKYIIDLFLKGYKLESIISSLNYHFLLNNANRFQEFLISNLNDFKKRYDQISTSKLKRNFKKVFETDFNDDIVLDLLNVQIEKESIYDSLIEITRQEAVDANIALSSKNLEALKELISKTIEVHQSHESDQDKNNESYTSINYFNLDIILPFPINLVASRTIIIQYQFLFRHLINLQYTDKLINESWIEINKNKIWNYKKFEKPILKWILRSRSLHDRMKDFFRIYTGYLYNDIIDTNTKNLKFDKITNFEDFEIKLNNSLISNLKSAILTNEQLIIIFSKILQIINGYCKFLNSLRKVLILLDYELFNKYNERLKDEFNVIKNKERLEKLNLYLNEYLDSFTQHINGFMRTLNEFGEVETSDFKLLSTRLEGSFPAK